MCLRPCAVHILPREALVSQVPAQIALAWNIICDIIPLILNVIVIVDNIGSIMNVYVNFSLPVNANFSVMWSRPWDCTRAREVNTSIKHLLSFGANTINFLGH